MNAKQLQGNSKVAMDGSYPSHLGSIPSPAIMLKSVLRILIMLPFFMIVGAVLLGATIFEWIWTDDNQGDYYER